jgi:hypothetical protein
LSKIFWEIIKTDRRQGKIFPDREIKITVINKNGGTRKAGTE